MIVRELLPTVPSGLEGGWAAEPVAKRKLLLIPKPVLKNENLIN
jgi:hypothetical protein